VDVPARAEISVYDITGERIAVLHDGFLDAGQHLIPWDGTSASGHDMPSGMYFYTLRTGATVQTGSMIRK
jgi:hypothetical protein